MPVLHGSDGQPLPSIHRRRAGFLSDSCLADSIQSTQTFKRAARRTDDMFSETCEVELLIIMEERRQRNVNTRLKWSNHVEDVALGGTDGMHVQLSCSRTHNPNVTCILRMIR